MIKHIAALTHQLLFCVLFCPWLWWFCAHCTKVDLRNLRYEKYQNGFTRSGCDPCHFQEMYIHVIYMACNKAHLFPEHLQEISELQLTSQSGTLAALKLWNSKRPSWHTRYNVTHKHIYMSFKYLLICNLYILYTSMQMHVWLHPFPNDLWLAKIRAGNWDLEEDSRHPQEAAPALVVLYLKICGTISFRDVWCAKTAFPPPQKQKELPPYTHIYVYIIYIYTYKYVYVYIFEKHIYTSCIRIIFYIQTSEWMQSLHL